MSKDGKIYVSLNLIFIYNTKMKKIFLLLLLATFTFSPIVSNAGFFDFLNIKNNQVASVTSSLKSDSSVVFKKGDKAEVILKVQSALASQGFYKGNISGLIGPKTEIAISEWQKSKSLVVTGVLDISTINSILGLVEKSDNRDGGVSVSSIPVCSPNDSPWIKVKNPDGGETYHPGQNIKVGWASCNLPSGSEVFIAFNAASTDLSGGYTMVGSTPDDGLAQVTLPPASDFGTQQGDWYYGLHYKIGVGVSNSTTPDDYRDYSDNLFSILEDEDGLLTTECNAQLLYPHPGQSYNLEENSNGTANVVRVHVFLYINQNLYNSNCSWDTSGITFPIEGNNPPGGSAGLVSLDGGLTGYPMWIEGDHLYHQSIDFNPNNQNTPAGPYNLTVLDGEGHQIVVPINIQY